MNSFTTWLENHITLQKHSNQQYEKENAISHLVGSIASLVFLTIIIVRKNIYTSSYTFWGLIIYALANLLLYSSSTLYHHVEIGNLKRVLRLFDHVNIYILIAGTYTPLLMSIHSKESLQLTVIVWLVALIGIVLKVIFWGRYRVLHVLFYLLMGWMIIFFWPIVVPFLEPNLLKFVIAAGITYSLGVIFYALKKVKHSHLVWHIFCLVASTLFSIGFLIYLR
ncbi:MAG: PAQR family membrane homeostasis protein TrhA [Sphaerochaetaceae bacterium]|jgi:hemolysin III